MQMQLVPATGKWLDKGSAGQDLAWYQGRKAAGVSGVILDLETGGWEADLQNALAAGLQVQVFQGYYAPLWTEGPSAATARAQQAIDAMHTAGLPVSSIGWLDVEDWPTDATAAEAMAWITAWGSAIAAGHMQAGGYQGSGTPLTGDDWWNITTLHRYWRSASMVPTIPNRGYQIVQTAVNQDADGVAVDLDTVQHDLLGSAPVAIVAVPGTVTVSVPTTPSVPAVTAADLAALDQQVTLLRQDLAAGIQTITAALPTKGTLTLS
jgi:hypothetical protein